MRNPQKVVFVIGNGFDLDLGLKTAYKDFWQSDYCPKNYPAQLIQHLNQFSVNNLDEVKWYDLENELLNYYHSINDKDNGVECLNKEEIGLMKIYKPYGYFHRLYDNNTVESLITKGILIQDGNKAPVLNQDLKDDCLKTPVWRDKRALEIIKNSFCDYLNSLQCPANSKTTIAFQVILSLDIFAGQDNDVNIYSFNYTPLKINGFQLKNVLINYMHGCCEKGNIILGTRDDLEINRSYDFIQKSFSPNYNPPALVSDLHDADEIIIFGHSIGTNDRQYFKAFFTDQTNYTNQHRKCITIFTRDHNSEIEIKRSLQTMTNGNLSALYSQNDINIIKTMNLQEDLEKLLSFFMKHRQNEKSVSAIFSKLTHNPIYGFS